MKKDINIAPTKYFALAVALCGVLFLFYLGAARSAEAATLYFSPSSGSYTVGEDFFVEVYVSSPDQAMNAVSGETRFSHDLLEATSFSKAGSIINLWVQEPLLTDGISSFEGIVFNPGFIGSAGKIATLYLKAKTAGAVSLTFSSGAVLANDGRGTNILTLLGSAQFQVQAATAAPPPAPPPASPPISPSQSNVVPERSVPLVSIVSSSTHPDPAVWYAHNDPTFAWSLPLGVTDVNIFHDRKPDTNPGTKSDGLFKSYTYTDLDDGVWYFHIRFKNAAGWGPVTHVPFHIDTGKPERFEMQAVPREDRTEPRITFVFDAHDSVSGIDHYEIAIDGAVTEVWRDDGSHTYVTPPLRPGTYAFVVKAVDAAGNSLSRTAAASVEALEPPRISEYPRTFYGGSFVVKGTTYPNARVILSVQQEVQDVKQYEAQSDAGGKFQVSVEEEFSEGNYTLWAEAQDSRGAYSALSEKASFVVTSGSYSPMWPWLFAIALLVLLWRLFPVQEYMRAARLFLVKRLENQLQRPPRRMHEAFDAVTSKKRIREHIKLLETGRSKRQLTEEETHILIDLKHIMDATDESMPEDIERK